MPNEQTSNKSTESTKANLPVKSEDASMPVWVTSILSAIGGVATNYLMHIKPLQERVNILTEQLREVKDEAKLLKQENVKCQQAIEKITKQLEDIHTQQTASPVNGYDYLPLKKSTNQTNYFQKRI